MGILCKIFGHKAPVYAQKGWWSPGQEYAKIHCYKSGSSGRLSYGYSDGISRVHGKIMAECPRCKKEWMVCRVHVPTGLDKFGEKELPEWWRDKK